MNKTTIDKIISDYESDKENKKFFSIITNNNRKYGQTLVDREPLSKFEMFDDETLLVEFGNKKWYIAISDITEIFFRAKFLR